MKNSILSLKNSAENLTILYVEDEQDILHSMTNYLEKFFHTVYTAANGKIGLELYEKYRPDIVITDINMPVLDGFQMAQAIRNINEDQNILVISAYSDTENFTRFIQLGIDGYILKPIDFEQLNTALYKVAYKITQYKENIQYKQNLEHMVEEKNIEVQNLEEQKIENYKKTLFALIKMLEDRDTYTGGHSLRVASYARLIGKEMGFD